LQEVSGDETSGPILGFVSVSVSVEAHNGAVAFAVPVERITV
jgi:hypothetical protein